jgi:hypothetical protein
MSCLEREKSGQSIVASWSVRIERLDNAWEMFLADSYCNLAIDLKQDTGVSYAVNKCGLVGVSALTSFSWRLRKLLNGLMYARYRKRHFSTSAQGTQTTKNELFEFWLALLYKKISKI